MEHAIKVPDIGSSASVDVIEVLVKVGDSVEIDTPLITLESDKASMEIPCTEAGVIKQIHLKIGDKVNQGDLILTLESEQEQKNLQQPEPVKIEEIKSEPEIKSTQMPVETPAPRSIETPEISTTVSNDSNIAAGPAVRRLARTLGVNLTLVAGSGRKSRITLEDVEQYVKMRLQQPASVGMLQLPSSEQIDFSQFGPIEKRPLSKIKKLSGQNLHKSWLQIPHVTQFDEADITDLEAFRKEQSTILEKEGVKITILSFLCKAVCRALEEFPNFNASLSSDGQELIVKNFINIGIAVDTPQGLVVPVIKNANQLSIRELATKMAELSQKARQKALTPLDMSGGTFTISSLGGIGGTAFTPIVNHPEVAILGVSKSSIKPIYQNNQFIPRLMLPLSLSYDHRVIDGAEGARFTKYLAALLSDIRKIML